MPLTANAVELLAQWCALSEAIADIRAKARSDFFGYDEPGTIKYMTGADELNTRERRFLGWFAFSFRLPDGQHPAELAASNLLKGADLESTVKVIQGTRYIMAVVTMIIPGKVVFLELENETFELHSNYLSREFQKDDVLCLHLLPVGRNRWVHGPGWMVWPVRFGSGIRSNLKKIQFTPVEVERFLQQRKTGNEKPQADRPRDNTLAEAVTRMTKAAKEAGKNQFIRSQEEWEKIIISCMKANNFNRFSKDIVKWAGNVASMDELNSWLALSTNIWNNVPQPDRGNRSANEIIAEYDLREKGPESKAGNNNV
jgi:hypothetical protein